MSWPVDINHFSAQFSYLPWLCLILVLVYTNSLKYSLNYPDSFTVKVVFDLCSPCICGSPVFHFENFIFDAQNILRHCLCLTPRPVQSP